jgi:hypothetical protein
VLATARIGAPRPRIVNYRVAPHVYTLENIGGSSFVATSTRKSRFLLLLLLRTRGTQKNERNGESACDFFMYSCVLVGGCCCVLCVPFAVPSVDVGYTTKKRDFFFFFHDFRRSASNMACLSSCVGCWILHILCPNSQLRPTPIWVACESCEVAIFFDFFFFFSRVHPPPPSLPVKEQQSLSTLTPSCGSQFRPFQYAAPWRQMERNLGPRHGVWHG